MTRRIMRANAMRNQQRNKTPLFETSLLTPIIISGLYTPAKKESK